MLKLAPMKYRPEIDGLRALAVVPVILFHAGVQIFSGGFVGVDVFFVISGYLITTILLTEMDAGRFSLLDFYERRARRILPALFTVIAFCSPFAWAWLLPEDFQSFAQSVVAVCLFGSNLLFWRESGYFDAAAELKPLLHTWSLALEEQYYLFFPLFLMLAWKLGKRRIVGLLVVCALLSFALAQWSALHRPSFAFYLLPTRAWELLLGSLAAFYLRAQPTAAITHGVREGLSAAGIGALAYANFAFDKTTSFPGLPALVPTLGTLSIILFARSDTLVGRLLASKPLVGVGLVSYSAYLWHQPLFAFARHRSIEEPDVALITALCIAVVPLAYLTWKFVEQPFRNRQRFGRKQVFSYSVASTAIVLFIGVTAAVTLKVNVPGESTAGQCNVGAKGCYEIKGATYRVALWGDSYADAFATSLAESLARERVSLHLFIKHSCPSLLGTVRNGSLNLGREFARDCERHNEEAAATILREKYDLVILTSAYERYISGRDDRGGYVLLDKESSALRPEDFLSRRFGETVAVAAASGARVLVITPHPTVENMHGARKEVHFGVKNQIYGDYDAADRTRVLLLKDTYLGSYDELDGRQFFCSDGVCPILDSSRKLLLYDGRHMSSSLAKVVAQDITSRIKKDRSAVSH